MRIQDLAELMGKSLEEVQQELKKSDVITIDLTERR